MLKVVKDHIDSLQIDGLTCMLLDLNMEIERMEKSEDESQKEEFLIPLKDERTYIQSRIDILSI